MNLSTSLLLALPLSMCLLITLMTSTTDAAPPGRQGTYYSFYFRPKGKAKKTATPTASPNAGGQAPPPVRAPFVSKGGNTDYLGSYKPYDSGKQEYGYPKRADVPPQAGYGYPPKNVAPEGYGYNGYPGGYERGYPVANPRPGYGYPADYGYQGPSYGVEYVPQVPYGNPYPADC